MTHLQAVRRIGAGLALALVAAGSTPGGAVAASGPCGGVPQITDVAGDGHHASSDVLSAWFSEDEAGVHANIRVQVASWVPDHDDADVIGSGFALLFRLGGQTRYVRATAPLPSDGPVRFDHGTYTVAGGFASAGPTTGVAVSGALAGTVTIDVPAAVGATAGSLLADPFVLTYDGIAGGVPTWVDHAPGGVVPSDPARGADFVVGACGTTPAAPGSPAVPGASAPGAVPGTPGAGTGGSGATTAIQLRGPSRLVGGGAAVVRGRVVPARAGVPVILTRRGRATAVSRVRTTSDGSFHARIAVRETTRVRATAEGISSQEVRVVVQSTVRITVRRLSSGGVAVTGRVRPALPGRVLWLRTTSVAPSASRPVSGSTFTFRLRNPTRGRYQAVFIPAGARAERSTSNTGDIR